VLYAPLEIGCLTVHAIGRMVGNRVRDVRHDVRLLTVSIKFHLQLQFRRCAAQPVRRIEFRDECIGQRCRSHENTGDGK